MIRHDSAPNKHDNGTSGLGRLVFAALLLLVIVALFVPLSPFMPSGGLDPSWWIGMNQALSQSLEIGKDIVFTFGPYASIYTKQYHPATDGLMVWGSTYLALSLCLLMYILFRSKGIWYKTILLASLATLSISRDALFFFHPLLAVLYAYQASDDPARDDHHGIVSFLLPWLIFAPLGLYPQTKASMLVICIASSVLSATIYLEKRQTATALIAIVAPILSFILAWALPGQSLASIPLFFDHLRFIVGGYTEAMATKGRSVEIVLYLLGATACVWMCFSIRARRLPSHLCLLAMLGVTLFLAFKAGFVRHDGHAMIAASVLFYSALFMATLVPCKVKYIAGVAIACVTSVIITHAYVDLKSPGALRNVRAPIDKVFTGMKQRLTDRGFLSKVYHERLETLSASMPLPLLSGSTDIYSHNQAHLIASGNQWNPRPILQSYSAYTPELLELNKNHLLSEHAPANIFFQIQAIDNRLPSLEEGISWPALFNLYQPTAMASGFLQLERLENTPEKPRVELEHGTTITARLGDEILLPSHNGPIFMKLDIRPTMFGKVLGLLYKPTQLIINIQLKNGQTRSRRLIAGMAKTEFLVSPYVEDTEEFAAMYAQPALLVDKEVRSVQVLGYRDNLGWEKDMQVQFLPARFTPLSGTPNLYTLNAPVAKPETFKLESTQQCDASIDYVNGMNPAPPSTTVSSVLKLKGWIARSTTPPEPANEKYLILTRKNQDHRAAALYSMNDMTREDVGIHFGDSTLNSSGFNVHADTSQLKGDYDASIGYLENGIIRRCMKHSFSVTVR